jgi:calcium-dependent protein kinase
MIDFGLSKHFELGESLVQKVGTPYTVAPEIIRGSYDEKCDLWALGVITYLLLCGETPFGGLDGENMILVKQSILRAQVHFEPWEVWEHVSSEGKAFVKRLLQADPKKRPTAREAQLDPWIQVWAKKVRTDGRAYEGPALQAAPIQLYSLPLLLLLLPCRRRSVRRTSWRVYP